MMKIRVSIIFVRGIIENFKMRFILSLIILSLMSGFDCKIEEEIYDLYVSYYSSILYVLKYVVIKYTPILDLF